jgi:ketol-acid reductoisomerase
VFDGGAAWRRRGSAILNRQLPPTNRQSTHGWITSTVFETASLELGGTTETIVKGGRRLFRDLAKAFPGVRQIGVLGGSSQGPAQAQNLRDSLDGSGIKVVVGLREGSPSIASAERAGFTRSNGTLGEMYQVIHDSDLVLLLVADAAQAKEHERIFAAMRPGTTLGLSHGFLVGHLKSIGASFPDNINVVGVCPKGMGPSVRRLYEQGADIDGAGINASFAVHQDVTGHAREIALGWSVALGAPYTFETTLDSEYRSDIFGERGILLGAVHGIVEVLYRHFAATGMSAEDAFINSVETITGQSARPSRIMDPGGVRDAGGRRRRGVSAGIQRRLPPGIRDSLGDLRRGRIGNEIRSVVMANERFAKYPMGKIDGTPMWAVGEQVRRRRGTFQTPLNPVAAGVYIATMMAQVDLLRLKGHPYSEIANESIIEAVDSLNPYMHFRGVAFMIDNCSTTARWGRESGRPVSTTP